LSLQFLRLANRLSAVSQRASASAPEQSATAAPRRGGRRPRHCHQQSRSVVWRRRLLRKIPIRDIILHLHAGRQLDGDSVWRNQNGNLVERETQSAASCLEKSFLQRPGVEKAIDKRVRGKSTERCDLFTRTGAPGEVPKRSALLNPLDIDADPFEIRSGAGDTAIRVREAEIDRTRRRGRRDKGPAVAIPAERSSGGRGPEFGIGQSKAQQTVGHDIFSTMSGLNKLSGAVLLLR
jgi:hypothetical protein